MNMPYLPKVSKWERVCSDPESPKERFVIILIVLVVLGVLLFSFPPKSRAEEINVEKLATAIYYAEGGSKTSHPYGILAHYKTTTPRQACINTIKHAQRDFEGGDFIAFLGSRYCPVGCSNDNGTNRFWVGNVRKLYARLK